jgi:hypothetical protein
VSDSSQTVRSEDIFDADRKYNPKNRWNIRESKDPDTEGCIAHMIRENNTLFEAADLVADASVIVKDDNQEDVTDEYDLLRLMNVSKESPNRNSDPLGSPLSVLMFVTVSLMEA